jgi:GT2 family glycosyltransferase
LSGLFRVSNTISLVSSVSIVIPNWNGQNLLAEYFSSVISAAEDFRSHSRVEIIVVDDGSTDDSCEWLRENYGANKSVKIVELKRNVGFLRAVNIGFQAATHDVVFLLNSDVQMEPDCIAPIVRHFKDENVFAVCCRAGRINSERLDGGGKIGRFERGFWRVFLNYEVINDETETELTSFYGSGGYTAYDRRKWKQLDGFQDLLSPNYWEDVEICYRAWKRGWKVIYEPAAHVRHLGSASMNKKDRSEINVVTERNRLLFTWINVHDPLMFTSHFFWLAVKLAAAAISLKWSYLKAFWAAMAKLSKVRALRSIEKNAGLISDRVIERMFLDIVHQPGIYVVEDENAELAFAALRDSRLRELETSN